MSVEREGIDELRCTHLIDDGTLCFLLVSGGGLADLWCLIVQAMHQTIRARLRDNIR